MTLRQLMDRAAALRMQAITQGFLKLTELTVIIDPRVHDNDRHFAACNERAREIRVAPQLADEPLPIIDGILMHELGHAVDFAFPAQTYVYQDDGQNRVGLYRSLTAQPDRASIWKARTPYRVETDADRIAEALFNVRIGYVGDRMLQSTEGGVRPRPFGI